MVIDQLYFLNLLGNRMPLMRMCEFRDHFPINGLNFDSFGSGPSDYDMASDQLYCPCDDVLEWDSGRLGDAIRIASKHLLEKHGVKA